MAMGLLVDAAVVSTEEVEARQVCLAKQGAMGAGLEAQEEAVQEAAEGEEGFLPEPGRTETVLFGDGLVGEAAVAAD